MDKEKMLNVQKECAVCSHYKETGEYDSLVLTEILLKNVYSSTPNNRISSQSSRKFSREDHSMERVGR